MGHADGICSIYIDAAADLTKAVPIIVDSKTNYPAACNSTERIFVHRYALPVRCCDACGDISRVMTATSAATPNDTGSFTCCRCYMSL
jgi:gamma-glutamyl phosphate reductase